MRSPISWRGGDLVVQPGAVREEIKMVGGGGAAREGQLGQGGLGGGEDILRVQARPDRVERGQPVEEVGILGGRDGARQGLVEMVMGVDQAGQDQVAGQVEDFIGLVGQTGSCPYLFDEAVANKKTTVGNLPLVVIHCKDMCVCDE